MPKTVNLKASTKYEVSVVAKTNLRSSYYNRDYLNAEDEESLKYVENDRVTLQLISHYMGNTKREELVDWEKDPITSTLLNKLSSMTIHLPLMDRSDIRSEFYIHSTDRTSNFYSESSSNFTTLCDQLQVPIIIRNGIPTAVVPSGSDADLVMKLKDYCLVGTSSLIRLETIRSMMSKNILNAYDNGLITFNRLFTN